MKITRVSKKVAQRRMDDLAPGECFEREGAAHQGKLFMVVLGGEENHALDLYTGELLDFTHEIVTPVEAKLEYTPWIEEEK
jgi:hypothetical protein